MSWFINDLRGHQNVPTLRNKSKSEKVKVSSENKVDKAEFHQQIPVEPGRKSAILLAGLMHVLLILFLWVGVTWQSETPVGVEAEIWDMNTRSAAPLPAVRHTPPPTEVKRKAPAPLVKEQEQEQEAEIAIERARQKKLIEQKRLEEKEEKQREEKQKQKENLLKEEKKKQESAKIAEQKKADALLQQQRNDNLKRLTNQLAGQLAGTGDAVKSTGNNRVDPGYAGKIAAKIKSNMVYVGTDNGPDNPTADFVINLFPDGSLKGAPRKTKSSGVPAFDDAVERAITKSAPYPADKSGKVPSTIPLTYRLKD